MGRRLKEWVPDRTPLASAQQAMQSHGFTCAVTSFSSPEQMTNHDDAILDGPEWKVILERDGLRQAVTNLSYLDCKRTNPTTCVVRFILLNGEVEGHRASGTL